MTMEKHRKLFAKQCPAPVATFAPRDEGTLWMVAYRDDNYEGELAITMGDDAEANAVLYAASHALLDACRMAKRACEAEGQGYEKDPLWRTLSAALRLAGATE
jgi:hypothetical protein